MPRFGVEGSCEYPVRLESPRPGRLIEPLVVIVGVGVRRAVLVVALAWAGLLAGAAGALAQPAFIPVAGSPFPTVPTNPRSVAFSPSPGLLATAHELAPGQVSVFSVAADGALTAAVGTPVQTPARLPVSVAFSPSGRLLATANSGGSVSVFSVAPDGVLTSPVTASTGPGSGPMSVAFSPSGGLLATANQLGNSVSVFRVGDNGVLTPVTGSPFPTGPAGLNPKSVAFSPSGGLLATANETAPGSVSVFLVDADGALTAVGTPVRTPGRLPVSVAFSPSGELLATANSGPGSVSVFSVAADGVLTSPVTTSTGVGSGPMSVAFSPSGGLLATANKNVDTMSVFSVADGGALTPVTDSPFMTGSGPISVAFSPFGGLLATANQLGDSVSMFAPTRGFVIGKAADHSEIAPGKVLSYKITLRPAGPAGGSGEVIDDLKGVLDKASYQNDAHASMGTVRFDAASEQLVWSGMLAQGEEATITYSVKVDGSAAGLVHNEVDGPPGSSCASPAPPELPCITETPIVRPPAPGPDLALTKTASSGTVHPGGQVSFTLAVRNNGPGEASGVTVQDPVPSGLFLQSAQPSQGSCTLGVDQLVCRLGSLVSGGQALVSVTYTVAADATGKLVNEASVFGDQHDPHPSDNVARSAVTVTPLPVRPPDPGPQPIANLVVVKHVNHSTALVGQKLTYTIKVTNAGPNAASDVQVIDASRRPLKVLSIHPNQGSCTTGRPIRCRLGTLGSHKHTTITIKAIAQVAGVQVNAVVATSASWDPAVRNNLALAKTRIRRLVTPPPPAVTG